MTDLVPVLRDQPEWMPETQAQTLAERSGRGAEVAEKYDLYRLSNPPNRSMEDVFARPVTKFESPNLAVLGGEYW